MDKQTMETDPVNLRLLGLKDLEYLLDWRMEVLSVVFADSEPWDYDALRKENRDYYQSHLGTTHLACMASINGIDVGCGALCFQEEMPSPDNPTGLCAYIMNIYTRLEARNHGVAHGIVRHLIEAAKDWGAGKISLEATTMAQSLYESLGFEPMEAMYKLHP